MNHFKSQRVGKFKVSWHLIQKGNTEKLLDFFGNFIIVEARHFPVRNIIEYTAFSLLFDSVPEGHEAPEYVIEVGENRDTGVITHKAKKVDGETECPFCHAKNSRTFVRAKKVLLNSGRLFHCKRCGFIF